MKLLIVDDERLARSELSYLVQKHAKEAQIFEADSFDTAIEMIRKLDFTAVFLDIDLAGYSGLDIARLIQEEKAELAIIFSTAFDSHAITAFQLNAIDYILKPYDEKDIERALLKLSTSHSKVSQPNLPIDKLLVWLADKALVLDVKEIVFFNAENKETLIHTRSNTYHTKQSLSYFETRLQTQGFMRIQRSFMVNLQTVTEIIPWFNHEYALKLKDVKDVIPVSRSKIKDLKKHFDF
jgi:two-component system, LytTR family, response regulator LytT